MARPSLFTHRKFRRLSRILGSRALALGSLELLWHCGYQDGDANVGDTTDLEDAADWRGDPGALTKALVESGFIDETPDGYLIHDLYDHAPDYVRRRRQRVADRCGSDQSLTGQSPASDQAENATPIPSHPIPSHPIPEARGAPLPPSPAGSGSTPPSAGEVRAPKPRKPAERLESTVDTIRDEALFERLAGIYADIPPDELEGFLDKSEAVYQTLRDKRTKTGVVKWTTHFVANEAERYRRLRAKGGNGGSEAPAYREELPQPRGPTRAEAALLLRRLETDLEDRT